MQLESTGPLGTPFPAQFPLDAKQLGRGTGKDGLSLGTGSSSASVEALGQFTTQTPKSDKRRHTPLPRRPFPAFHPESDTLVDRGQRDKKTLSRQRQGPRHTDKKDPCTLRALQAHLEFRGSGTQLSAQPRPQQLPDLAPEAPYVPWHPTPPRHPWSLRVAPVAVPRFRGAGVG